MDCNIKAKVIIKVCRTCMTQITDDMQFMNLNAVVNSNDPSITVGHKLNSCIPQLNLDGRFSTVICSDCVTALDFVDKFKQKCLATEKLISDYIQGRRAAAMNSDIDTEESIKQFIEEENQPPPHLEVVDSKCVLLNSDTLYSNETENQPGNSPEDVIEIIEDDENDDTNWLPACTVPDNKSDSEIVESKNNVLDVSRMDCSNDDLHSKQLKSKTNHKTLTNCGMSTVGMKYNFKCKICTFSTLSNVTITKHVRNHLSCQNFTCQFCDFTSLTVKEMIDHVKVTKHIRVYKSFKGQGSDRNIFQCEDCGKIFYSEFEFTKHRDTHIKDVICLD